MRVEIDHKLLDYQLEILQSSARTIVFSGGVGSAKTYTGCLLTVINLLQGRRCLLITPTHAMTRDIHLLQMQEILDDWRVSYTVNKTHATIDIAGKSGKLFVKSEENKETINGLTKISFLCMDECRLISERAFTYGLSRMRDLPAGVSPKILLIGTGCSKSHWFAREAMAESSFWVKKGYKDNPFNGKEYIDLIEEKYKDLEETFRRRELYGEFTDNFENSLFTDINFTEWNQGKDIYGGLDIAINGGADYSAATILQGNKVIFYGKRKTLGLQELTAWKAELQFQYNCKNWCHDHTGLGNDLEIEESTPVFFGASAAYPYSNKRVEIYYSLKKFLSDGIFFANPDFLVLFQTEGIPELELTRIRDKLSRNLMLIEKEDIKKVLGRSPDLSDSMALAAYCRYISKDVADLGAMRDLQRANNPFAGGLLLR